MARTLLAVAVPCNGRGVDGAGRTFHDADGLAPPPVAHKVVMVALVATIHVFFAGLEARRRRRSRGWSA